jgi:hypothetical protein
LFFVGCVYGIGCLVCIVVILCLFAALCIAFFTLDVELLATSQYSEGPATDHLGTGFSFFPSVYRKCCDGSHHSKLPLHASHVAHLTLTLLTYRIW